jgi:hypothetical protein
MQILTQEPPLFNKIKPHSKPHWNERGGIKYELKIKKG